MEKKHFLMFIMLALVGLVAAGYTMSSFLITANVAEPFELEYVIVESDDIADCQAEGLPYDPITDFTMPDIYPGESRAFCLKINNSASIELPFELTSEVNATNDNLDDCEYALGNPGISGDAAKNVSIHGTVITVPTDAMTVSDCELTLSVDRG